jgi:inosine-uridine nucleoside N-ribohydrolase
LLAQTAHSQTEPPTAASHQIILDTDIGDDIDDAFALALALQSREIKLLGVTTATGDTKTRAQLALRMLRESGYGSIPVATGRATRPPTTLTQEDFARDVDLRGVRFPSAVDFTLGQIRKHPHQIELVAIGPLTNLADMIDKDPATFHLLKRIVIMGGDIPTETEKASPEWNIKNDIPAAQKVFASGVPMTVFPLNSTRLRLDQEKRKSIFRQASPLTYMLTALYYQWGRETPTLFDAMTIASLLQADVCPTIPMQVSVDEKGSTVPSSGAPNVDVCLTAHEEQFFQLYLRRILAKNP